MDTPTPEALRTDSDLLALKLPASSENDAKLTQRATVTAAIVAAITGRQIDPVTEGVEVPAGLQPLAIHAIARFVERRIIMGAAATAEKTAMGRLLRGFTAGPYSESYFSPGDLQMKGGRPVMDADADLDETLWALATEEARANWIAQATGVQPPAGVASTFDYRRMGNSFAGLAGFGRGPDGF